MIALFVYTLAAFGLAYVLGHSTITLSVREWLTRDQDALREEWRVRALLGAAGGSLPEQYRGSLLSNEERLAQIADLIEYRNLGAFGRLAVMLVECPACLGFWIGLFAGIVYSPFDHPRSVGVALVLGFYTCSTNYLLGRAARLISEA